MSNVCGIVLLTGSSDIPRTFRTRAPSCRGGQVTVFVFVALIAFITITVVCATVLNMGNVQFVLSEVNVNVSNFNVSKHA